MLYKHHRIINVAEICDLSRSPKERMRLGKRDLSLMQRYNKSCPLISARGEKSVGIAQGCARNLRRRSNHSLIHIHGDSTGIAIDRVTSITTRSHEISFASLRARFSHLLFRGARSVKWFPIKGWSSVEDSGRHCSACIASPFTPRSLYLLSISSILADVHFEPEREWKKQMNPRETRTLSTFSS